MERKRQRDIALAAVAIAVIAVTGFQIRTQLSRGTAAGASQGTGGISNVQQHANHKGAVAPVDLEALQSERPEPVQGTRNPFRFRPKPAPPPPPPNPSRLGQRQVPPQPQVPPLVTGPIGPPPPPRILLRFIGTVEGREINRTAILTDGRGVYYGKEGGVIEGRYRILRIGVESVELAYLDGRGRQVIPRTGQ
jgi:hypothetical protein